MKHIYTFQTKPREKNGIKTINILFDKEKDIQSQLANQMINYKADIFENYNDYIGCNLIPNYGGHIQLYKNLNGQELLQMIEEYIYPLNFVDKLIEYEIKFEMFKLEPQNFAFYNSDEFIKYKSSFKSSEHKIEYLKHCYFFEKVYFNELITKYTLILFENKEKGSFEVTFF